MTPADLDRLEQLAAAATPGPWQLWPSHEYRTGVNKRTAGWVIEHPVGAVVRANSQAEDADGELMAALDPATVLELVEAARLGAAWQEAEAALPEGWVTGLIGIAVGTGRWYTASAYVDLTDYADDHEAESAQADSPAAALLSLAEALRGRSG